MDSIYTEGMTANPTGHGPARRVLVVSCDELGLTLVEMIVVLAIIALIAALIVPNIIGRPDQARVTVAHTDVRSIAAALKMYRLDNGDYPSTAQGLAALVTKPTAAPVPPNWAAGGYLGTLPIDPWGRPYVYHNPGEGGADFDLISLGKDGKPGGEGLAADISAGAPGIQAPTP